MIHKGNIANITITTADVVDCVIGGSPCQGLSVAGKRLGLSDERSGLFMEQIRIIKEMREVDKRSGRSGINVRPRWGVWENVPGALSSGTPKGEDFRIVLEEFIKIADPTATVPRPARGGWNNSGCIVGDGYSLAWRIMDARYHGVPQRRRRITLIVDFAGDSASKVLFNEEGMRWDFETSQRAWKAIAKHFGNGAAGGCGRGLGSNRGVEQKKSPGADLHNARLTVETANTLNANTCLSENHADPAVCQPIVCKETGKVYAIDPLSSNSMKSSNPYSGFRETDYAKCLDTSGGNPVCNQGGIVVCHAVCAFSQNQREEVRELGEIAGSVSSQTGTHQQTYVVEAFVGGQGEKACGLGYRDEETPTLKSTTSGSNTVPDVVYAIDGNVCDRVSKKNGCGYSEDVSPTLNTQDRHAVAYDIGEARLRNPSEYDEESPTITARCGSGGNNVPAVVYDARGNGDGETVQTLTGDHARTVSDYTTLVCSIDGRNCAMSYEMSGTLQAKPTGGQSLNYVNPVCIEQTKCVYWDGGQVANTLTKKGMDQRMPDKGQFQCVLQPKRSKYIVRRLTPLECSRLQGMPDDWCDIHVQSNVTQEDLEHWLPILDEWAKINGKKPKSDLQIAKWLTTPISESAQYQMYGNGIALPQWVWTLGRIIETYGEQKPTMASLFDGTGSFPLIWNSILGGAYTVWSSEVNPDAVRVSKYRMEERGW